MKKTVIVTGASRGIGKATAKLFAQENYNVVIQYFNSTKQAEQLLEEISEFGSSAILCKANLTQKVEVDEMINVTLENFGNIDVLVNNAGIAQTKLFTDITDDDWDNMMNTNLKSMFYTCKAVLPTMINNKKGKIINVSSMWGQVGASCEVHYSVSKAGIIGLTKALAMELAPSNITVNGVAPGVIKTDMLSGYTSEDLKELAEQTPLGRLGTAEDVANSIYFLASPRSDFLTGQIICPNGGYIL